jgi:tetratricopeptide (TPR) repeat protein
MTALALTCLLAAADTRFLLGRQPGTTQPSAADLRSQAIELAYNLDYDEALALLREAIRLAPDDPAPHRTIATVLWLKLLFLRGAVTVDHYLGTFSRSRVDLKAPPPEIDAEFRRHVERARELAERRLAKSPRDVQAAFELGATSGLQASYTATVEGRLLAGFRTARRSFDLHETVLSRDPSRSDAGLIVGTYRYLVSTLSLPMRTMAYIVGFGGNREQGIALLQAAAAGATDASPDALFALVLIYNRERRYDEALAALRELRRRYPRNRLVLLEAGATAARAGRGAEAEALLDEGLAQLARDPRTRVPGEVELWHLKRGGARLLTGDAAGADADLQRAAGAGAQPWVAGRARLELGRLALSRGRHDAARDAAAQAASLCERGNDPACVEGARQLARRARGR